MNAQQGEDKRGEIVGQGKVEAQNPKKRIEVDELPCPNDTPLWARGLFSDLAKAKNSINEMIQRAQQQLSCAEQAEYEPEEEKPKPRREESKEQRKAKRTGAAECWEREQLEEDEGKGCGGERQQIETELKTISEVGTEARGVVAGGEYKRKESSEKTPEKTEDSRSKGAVNKPGRLDYGATLRYRDDMEVKKKGSMLSLPSLPCRPGYEEGEETVRTDMRVEDKVAVKWQATTAPPKDRPMVQFVEGREMGTRFRSEPMIDNDTKAHRSITDPAEDQQHERLRHFMEVECDLRIYGVEYEKDDTPQVVLHKLISLATVGENSRATGACMQHTIEESTNLAWTGTPSKRGHRGIALTFETKEKKNWFLGEIATLKPDIKFIHPWPTRYRSMVKELIEEMAAEKKRTGNDFMLEKRFESDGRVLFQLWTKSKESSWYVCKEV